MEEDLERFTELERKCTLPRGSQGRFSGSLVSRLTLQMKRVKETDKLSLNIT